MAAIGVIAGVDRRRGGDRCRWRVPSAVERTGAPRGPRPDSVELRAILARIPRCPSRSRPPRPPVRRGSCTADDERVDPWFWLRDRDDPEVLAYLEAENAYTGAALAHLAPLRTRAVRRDRRPGAGDRRQPRRSAAATTSTSPAPSRASSTTCTADGPHAHRRRAARSARGAGYARRRGRRARRERARRRPRLLRGRRPRGEPRPGRRRVQHRHHRRRALRAARSERWPRPAMPRRRTSTTSCPTSTTAWRGPTTTRRSSTPVPTTPCARGRSGGTRSAPRASDDVLVFQEDDDRFYVGVGRTRSERFLVITTASKMTSEVWLVDADAPDVAGHGRRAARAGPRVPRRAPRRPGRRPALRAHQRRRRRELQARW